MNTNNNETRKQVESGSAIDMLICFTVGDLKREQLEETAANAGVAFDKWTPDDDLRAKVIEASRAQGGLKVFDDEGGVTTFGLDTVGEMPIHDPTADVPIPARKVVEDSALVQNGKIKVILTHEDNNDDMIECDVTSILDHHKLSTDAWRGLPLHQQAELAERYTLSKRSGDCTARVYESVAQDGSRKVVNDQSVLADQAFQDYEFGEGVEVTDMSGWEYSTPGFERARKVYVEVYGKEGAPDRKYHLTFTARFNPADGSLAEAYAIDDKGSIWGSMPERKVVVSAEVHSDDLTHEVTFDAAPYLAQASDKEIKELSACGWGGDLPADEVAEFFQGKNREIDALFEHLHSVRDLRSHKDMCGFECHVDKESAIAWIQANRPHLLKANKPKSPSPGM